MLYIMSNQSVCLTTYVPGTYVFVTNFTGFIMLKKKILFHLRKVLCYSIHGWIAAYLRNDKVLQYMYDQLYKQVNSAFEYAKMIERYEDRARL